MLYQVSVIRSMLFSIEADSEDEAIEIALEQSKSGVKPWDKEPWRLYEETKIVPDFTKLDREDLRKRLEVAWRKPQ